MSLCASMLGFTASAQDTPYTLNVFNQAIYYGMYEATVDEPIPAGAIRHSNSSYAKMLTEEQLASFGNQLTMTVTLNPLCDNYDRIGNVNLAFVPKGQTSYVYNEVKRLEIGRFITPFMRLTVTNPNAVPYVFDVDNLTDLFHDETLTAEYDFWVELEVYGYQGGPGQGGAAVEVPGCAGRNDVYMGTLDFESTTDTDIVAPETTFVAPMSFKYELKDYTLAGTDVLGETTRTIQVALDNDVENAKLYLITSNHGSNNGGEEYIRRDHFVYFDDALELQYKPGGVSCIPFAYYNTQPSCIYYDCSQNPSPLRPDTDAAWAWNNWCPGDKIPIRVIELGDLEAGEHEFKIDVPDAVFAGDQGYFPMSVYMQGEGQSGLILDNKKFDITSFSITPNPVNDVAVIAAQGLTVKSYTVLNTLGQVVLNGAGNNVNMSSLQNGVYMVQASFDNNTVATKKIIKN